MSITDEQKAQAREYADTLRDIQAFAKRITDDKSTTPYEREMARNLWRHAYKAEPEADLLGDTT